MTLRRCSPTALIFYVAIVQAHPVKFAGKPRALLESERDGLVAASHLPVDVMDATSGHAIAVAMDAEQIQVQEVAMVKFRYYSDNCPKFSFLYIAYFIVFKLLFFATDF
jgi:hypothetical protein